MYWNGGKKKRLVSIIEKQANNINNSSIVLNQSYNKTSGKRQHHALECKFIKTLF